MTAADDADNFKVEFKKYKRRDRPLDLSEIVDIRDTEDAFFSQKVRVVKPIVPRLPLLTGLLPTQDWEVFEFPSHPGFCVIKNPFLSGYQRYWVQRCLVDLPLPPNVTNLRVHPDIDPSTIWSEFVKAHSEGKGFSSDSSLRKLRWTTIGYHYDWDAKVYREDDYTPFPKDIGVLAQYVASALGFDNFTAEAGIINYYHLDSTLGGHTDHSELDHDAPLVSVSFGQSAIFLLGGPTKVTKPTAILLRSGDICVMSGPSRLAYHAVPRILAPEMPAPPSCFSLPEQSSQPQSESNVSQIGTAASSENSAQGRLPDISEVDSAVIVEGRGQGDLPSVNSTKNTSHINCENVKNIYKNSSEEENILQPDERHEHGGMSRPETGDTKFDQFVPSADTRNNTLSQCLQRDTDSLAQNSVDGINPSSTILPSTQLSGGQYGALRDNPLMVTLLSTQLRGGRCEHKRLKEVNEQISQTMKTIDWSPLSVYLSSSRLNLNIRQVLKPGQTFSSHTLHRAESAQNKKPRVDH